MNVGSVIGNQFCQPPDPDSAPRKGLSCDSAFHAVLGLFGEIVFAIHR
jgi:hypothetical protein